jgi:hypothetical protein
MEDVQGRADEFLRGVGRFAQQSKNHWRTARWEMYTAGQGLQFPHREECTAHNKVETWPIGPADVNKLETAQMWCLRHMCGDRSWGPDSKPYAEEILKTQFQTLC